MLLIDIAIAPNDIGEQLVEVSAAVLTNMKHEPSMGRTKIRINKVSKISEK